MTVSSPEPRGNGLSTSLVTDFRAILDALEKEKCARSGTAPHESAGAAGAASGEGGAESPATSPTDSTVPASPVAAGSDPTPVEGGRSAVPVEPSVPMMRDRTRSVRGEAAPKPTPMALSDVRSRISALGDVRDMFPQRSSPRDSEGVAEAAAAAAEISEARNPETGASLITRLLARKQPPAAAAAVTEMPTPRRRAFGASGRGGEAEQPVRRRKSASKDVITWQRLGVLAVCVAVFGGGLVALQRLAAREEAVVAPEEIGNAAIASVAPSAPLAVAAIPAAETVAVAAAPVSQPMAERTTPASVADVVAEIPKLNLRDAEPVFDGPATPAAPAGVTAFAAPEPPASPRLSETADAGAADGAEAAHVALPKQAPLPPVKLAALETPEATTAAAEPETEDTAVEAGDASGADPVGTAVVRSAVTMRAGPKKSSAAVLNLQGGEKVELVACKGWCEVVAEGKRGFIYKSFLNTQAVQQAEAAAE
ncbi:SH3 domain-containing protein [Ancylobacter pratisalsi]|uniref:SH3 domain-containing protein n=1 Tax=Ancylobacter pratisalsi TaxID=1745854 RepID=A0A6P1YUV6_9HYPH|nr:SH3 domain-containing protein [Ancylobacter pratisalsi]QIB35394.1 hypothetical protein G3A50_18035 [Ancylobacter pratisalsi]